MFHASDFVELWAACSFHPRNPFLSTSWDKLDPVRSAGLLLSVVVRAPWLFQPRKPCSSTSWEEFDPVILAGLAGLIPPFFPLILSLFDEGSTSLPLSLPAPQLRKPSLSTRWAQLSAKLMLPPDDLLPEEARLSMDSVKGT